MSRGRLAAALITVLGAVLGTGCQQQLLFRQDDRIVITNPANYSGVNEPLTITWTARDFHSPADGTFAVFVDRSPMPPGETVDHFRPNDRKGIFQTMASSLHIDLLSPVFSNASAERNHHEVTVVLLDTTGRRIGEEAGFVEFNVTGA